MNFSQFTSKTQEAIMLKLNVIVLFSIISFTFGSPISSYISIFDDLDDDNYDIIIDQRQNGTQNFRIRVNGLNLAIPAEEIPEENSQFTQEELISLLGISTSTHSSSSLNSDKNDFADFSALFDFKKNLKSNNKKDLGGDTQSRTKDIPTESQLTGDTRKSVKDYVKGEGKRYKLLVGEKYVIPLLQFLKRHADNVE